MNSFTPGNSGHLSLKALTKQYGSMVAVDNLDIEIAKGELVAFLGPSGCGKSTSLRIIAGLTPATSGRVSIGGLDVTDVPTYKRDIGLVFQSYALFPHMSVLKNVMFGLEMRKVASFEAETRAREAIALVQLSGREDRRPTQLSGGQQQRVALARALVIRPSILLFDEPLSNLDAKLRDEMRTEIRDIQQRLGITSIFVTHDQVEALSMCDKVAVLNGGRLEQFGTPEDLYERPVTPYVASFVGRINRLNGHSSGGRIDIGGMSLAGPGRHNGPVEIMVRPHRVMMQQRPPTGQGAIPSDGVVNRLSGTVGHTHYSGDLIQYEIETVGQTFMVERATTSREPLLERGSEVDVSWKVEDTLVFEAKA